MCNSDITVSILQKAIEEEAKAKITAEIISKVKNLEPIRNNSIILHKMSQPLPSPQAE